MVAESDRIVTAGVDTNLARQIHQLKQASRNAGEVSSILQAAAASVTLIDGNLTRMAELAGQATVVGLSSAERAILHEEFAAERQRIDEFAAAAKFADTAILDGSNTFTATSVGSNIQSGNGIQALTFDSRAGGEFVASGDTIAVEFDSTSDIFTVTNLSTGRGATSQAVAAAPGAGETSDIVIEEFGLTIQLNSSFSLSSDISDNNTLQVSGSATNQVDLGLRIGTGSGPADEISVDVQRIRVETLSSALQFDDLLTLSGAADAAVNVKTAQEVIDRFQSAMQAGQNQISFALDNIENTVNNYEAANANLIDIANSATQELLHEVVAENVNSVLSSTDNVSDALAKIGGLAKLSKSDQMALLAGGATSLAALVQK
jgi:flagellin|tara:strand:+ start:169 stop:1296 length:1128 start_codon:yes stop_codon:yes gene_type:complete